MAFGSLALQSAYVWCVDDAFKTLCGRRSSSEGRRETMVFVLSNSNTQRQKFDRFVISQRFREVLSVSLETYYCLYVVYSFVSFAKKTLPLSTFFHNT